MRRIEAIAVMMTLAAATPAMAQGRGRGNGGIPPGQRPPAGMCRIWIDGVPPGRQPAPTSCYAAERYVPRNGRVIYGDDTNQNRSRIYSSNGQVVFPQRAQQGCVQRTDHTGVTRTYCDNNNRVYNDQVYNGTNDRANRDLRRRMEERKHEYKKAKKHDKGDRDDDWNRNQDRQRLDRDRDNNWNPHGN